MLDVQLYGMNASGHHLTSLLLHLANSILLFLLLRRLSRAEWPCALVAALFALHPLRVESVAWIAERKDVLSAFFWMLAVWAYTRYVEESRSGGSRRKAWYAASLLLFALGLWQNPGLVTLPFVLLLLDYWPLRRLDPFLLRRVVEKIPFFALAAAASVMAFLAQRLGGSVAPLAALSMGPRLANALVSYARYMGKTLWPVDLAVLYPLQPRWPAWQVALAALLLALVTFWAVWRVRSRPGLAVGWFWFLGMLVPVIGLVQIGRQSTPDRYDYLPGIGLFIMLVWAAWDWLAPRNPRAGAVLGCLALAGCLAATRIQVGYWRTSETLFRHAVQATEDNGFMEAALGVLLVEEGDKDGGMAHLRRGLELSPENYEAHGALGQALLLQGRLPEAVRQFQFAAALSPEDSRYQYGLATALLQNGQAEDAIPHFQKSLQTLPDSAKTHCQLANALMQTAAPGPPLRNTKKSCKPSRTTSRLTPTSHGSWPPTRIPPFATGPKRSFWRCGPITFPAGKIQFSSPLSRPPTPRPAIIPRPRPRRGAPCNLPAPTTIPRWSALCADNWRCIRPAPRFATPTGPVCPPSPQTNDRSHYFHLEKPPALPDICAAMNRRLSNLCHP